MNRVVKNGLFAIVMIYTGALVASEQEMARRLKNFRQWADSPDEQAEQKRQPSELETLTALTQKKTGIQKTYDMLDCLPEVDQKFFRTVLTNAQPEQRTRLNTAFQAVLEPATKTRSRPLPTVDFSELAPGGDAQTETAEAIKEFSAALVGTLRQGHEESSRQAAEEHKKNVEQADQAFKSSRCIALTSVAVAGFATVQSIVFSVLSYYK